MKRLLGYGLGYGLLGLPAFLLFLVALAPATLITDRLSAQIPEFRVGTVAGTVIHASLRDLRWRNAGIAQLHWEWQPPALFRGALEFKLDADDPEAKMTGSVAMGWDYRWHFRDLAGHLPMAKLSALAGQANLPLRGMVEFSLRDLDLDAAGRPQSAEGTVQLQNLGTRLAQPLDFGNFVVQLTRAEPVGIQGTIGDRDGPLKLGGTFTLAPDGRYHGQVEATVRDPGNLALRQTMNLLGGVPDANGRWLLSFSGVLAW